MVDTTRQRPLARERLFAWGPERLSEVDLLALLISTGTAGEGVMAVARRVYETVGGLQILAQADPGEIESIRGVGRAKAARLCAALELGRRASREPWHPGEAFASSRQVYEHLGPLLKDERREMFLALYLDARHRLVGEREVSRGSLVASIVHPREVFRPAVQMAAAAVICVHNHPSGDAGHSPEDIAVTRRLYEAGRLLGIELLDHVILGRETYVSFLDERIPPFQGTPPPRREPTAS